MNQSSIDNSKKKFPHSTSRSIYSGTFFDHQKLCYLIQCESLQVIIGQINSKFEIMWKGSVKQKITCLAYSHKNNILYAGTAKGTIVVINLKTDQNYDKIDSIEGQPILAMVAYFNDATQLPELITINSAGKFRNYKDNKYVNSTSLPFQVTYAISNKVLKNKNDVAMVLFKPKGTYPYIFSVHQIIEMAQKELKCQQNKQEQNGENIAGKMISAYEASVHYEVDEQVKTEALSFVALSNSRAVLAISMGVEVCIFTIVKNGGWFSIVPDFKFKMEDEVTNIDIIDSSILYLSSRGISTFDLEKRRKVAKGLVFKGSQYDIIHWAEVGSSIVYGSTKANKMKMIFCELKGLAQQ